MSLAGRIFTVALTLTLALVPASAGAGAARAPVALTATPARVLLKGSGRAAVRVTNSGTKRVAVDVSQAGFALDLRGRPRIVRGGGSDSASGWLRLRPSHFTLEPRSSVSLVVTAKLPRRAEPGDYDGLALLRTRPLVDGPVAVRLRLGVVVVVRAPGEVVRRLQLDALRVARRRRRRVLELLVVNRGNVTESLTGARAVLSRVRTGRHLATLIACSRALRPGTRGIVEFWFRGHARGAVMARIAIPAAPGRRAVERSYRLRL